VENKCPACGFVNPDNAGFCFLCGVPFLGPSKAQMPTTPKPPARVKGESQEIDAADLPARLAEDEASMARNQEDLLKDLARLVPDGGSAQDPEALDALLSDFDGSSRPSLKVPILKPDQASAARAAGHRLAQPPRPATPPGDPRSATAPSAVRPQSRPPDRPRTPLSPGSAAPTTRPDESRRPAVRPPAQGPAAPPSGQGASSGARQPQGGPTPAQPPSSPHKDKDKP